MEEKGSGIAIVPGSFDPITIGHLDIVKRAAESHRKVYLAVMINREKKYMFSMEERERIARGAVSDIKNVEVISSDGMLWELARELNASSIVKGYRNDTDLEYERAMAEYNSARYPMAQTVLLKANAELTQVSSTFVREKIIKGEPLDGLLPENAISEINKIIRERQI